MKCPLMTQIGHELAELLRWTPLALGKRQQFQRRTYDDEERVLVLRSIAMTFSSLLDFVEPDLKGEEKRYKSNNV